MDTTSTGGLGPHPFSSRLLLIGFSDLPGRDKFILWRIEWLFGNRSLDEIQWVQRKVQWAQGDRIGRKCAAEKAEILAEACPWSRKGDEVGSLGGGGEKRGAVGGHSGKAVNLQLSSGRINHSADERGTLGRPGRRGKRGIRRAGERWTPVKYETFH